MSKSAKNTIQESIYEDFCYCMLFHWAFIFLAGMVLNFTHITGHLVDNLIKLIGISYGTFWYLIYYFPKYYNLCIYYCKR